MIPLLKGINVLEMSSVVMGPFVGQILADLGADVIKIEPLSGDIARETHPSPVKGLGALYLNNNRNKRVIALDIKHPAGSEVAKRLLKKSDVFLHNMREEAAERVGFGYAAAKAINPKIIYCAAIGYGQRGRYRDKPAYDDVIQAASGLAGLSQYLGNDPQFFPTIVADKVGALYAVYGILAALVARAQGHDESIKVEMSMFEALASFVLNEHLAGGTFTDTDPSVGYHRILSPNRRPYKTSDGWIVVLPYTFNQWTSFFREVGRTDILESGWLQDSTERSRRVNYLYGEIAKSLTDRSTDEWHAKLSKLDIPCSRVNSVADLLEDPHLEDVGFFKLNGEFPPEVKRAIPQPVQFTGIDPQPDKAAPPLGANTREILRACGYDGSEIEALLARGAVTESSHPETGQRQATKE